MRHPSHAKTTDDKFSLTLLQLAAGCALLVFGLRLLGPVPAPTPQWPAPAVVSALEIRTHCNGRDFDGITVAVEARSLQTAACFTANTPGLEVNALAVDSHF